VLQNPATLVTFITKIFVGTIQVGEAVKDMSKNLDSILHYAYEPQGYIFDSPGISTPAQATKKQPYDQILPMHRLRSKRHA
jgi:hypothetical protein